MPSIWPPALIFALSFFRRKSDPRSHIAELLPSTSPLVPYYTDIAVVAFIARWDQRYVFHSLADSRHIAEPPPPGGMYLPLYMRFPHTAPTRKPSYPAPPIYPLPTHDPTFQDFRGICYGFHVSTIHSSRRCGERTGRTGELTAGMPEDHPTPQTDRGELYENI